MGLLDFLFGRPAPVIADPAQLQRELFAVAASGDVRKLERLCRANRQAILEHFPVWQKVPDEVRADPAAIPAYAQSMIAIAQLFANRLDCPDLLQRLVGTEDSNPLVRWQRTLDDVRSMMADLQYVEAKDRLTDILIDVRKLTGSGADAYLPVTHGLLGECHFQSGAAGPAATQYEQALAMCEQTGDTAGVVAYLGNLFEVHRYLGHAELAAGYADRLAETWDRLGRAPDARRMRRRAAIVRAGEPLNRVVAVVGGTAMELDEVVPAKNMHVQFVFERNRVALRPAEELTKRGETLGQSGQYSQALAVYREAAAADAFDPHSRYQEAFTLLHLERYAEAADRYRQVEELAPGWFHCRADLWLAEQLTLGNVPHEVFLGLHILEDGQQSPEEKASLAEKMLARFPGLPNLHFHHGKNLARIGQKKEARVAFQRGLECDPEADVRTCLLVELGVITDPGDDRTRLLTEAVQLNGSLVAAASAALALRVGAEDGGAR